MGYEYLAGTGILFVLWLAALLLRKDLLKPMVWTALFYVVFNGILYSAWLIISKFTFIGTPYVPDYWNPDTLFNIGRMTGGVGIEDVLFVIFVSGIATFIYEFLFSKKIKYSKKYRPAYRVLIISGLSFFIFSFILEMNVIYPLIISTVAGAFAICLERRDLIKHSVYGGLSFLMVYIIAFSLFIAVFPDFIEKVYSLKNLSGISLFNVPVEEFLYAFSFGLMWAPMYEYCHRYKVVGIGKRKMAGK